MKTVNPTIKILFLVTQSEFGGAQRYIYEVARGLNPKKYEILVAAGQGDNELFEKLKAVEARLLRLRQMKRVLWPWQIVLVIAEIRGLLKKEKPDVLFLCSTTAGLLGSIASLFYGGRTSVIYRIGGWAFRDPRPFWQNWILLLAEKLTAPLKDKIIVNSELDRKLALKHKIAPSQKIVKIYNGIDASSLDFLPKEEACGRLNLAHDQQIVGTVANFYKTKGLEYLIKAMARLLNTECLTGDTRCLTTKLVIIGEGRLRPKLEAQIKKLELENKVILTGRIPDAYKYLKAFDVFILPSVKEGFPWIILEAVAAEIPIVATKVGAIPEILEEEFLVEPKSPKALAKKISRMLEHPAKAQLKQGFTSQKMIEETTGLLKSCRP